MKEMKIGKGVLKNEDGTTPIPAYVSKCATSLTRLLEDGEPVNIKAMGSDAIANVMKTIARVSRNLKTENKELKLDAPCFKNEDIEGTELAVFNISVKLC